MNNSLKIKFINPVYDYCPIIILIIATRFFLPIRQSVILSFSAASVLFALSFFFRKRILFWSVVKYAAILISYGIILRLAVRASDELKIGDSQIAVIIPCIVFGSFLALSLIFQQPITKLLKRKHIAPRFYEEFFRLAAMFLFAFLAYIILFFLFLHQEKEQFLAEELLFIMMIIIIIYEFIRQTIIKINLRKEEWLPIVDEKGNVLGKIEKKESLFSEKKYLHPIIRVHIIFNNTVYLQKRCSNDLIFPDAWDTAISNHVLYGETIDECIVRTAKQRYGLENIKPAYLNRYTMETEDEIQQAFVYCMEGAENLKPVDKKRIQMGKYWTIKQIAQELDSGIFTANFVREFEVLCEKVLDCGDLLEE